MPDIIGLVWRVSSVVEQRNHNYQRVSVIYLDTALNTPGFGRNTEITSVDKTG
jgi:hypothetical protein